MTNTPQHDPATAIALLLELAGPALHKVIREAVRAEFAAVQDQAPVSEWLDTKGAAAILGVHVKTVERLARAGEIKSARAGRKLRFRREDVNAYLEVTP